MIVTEIHELTKVRCRISLDNEIAFVLYKGDLRLFHIREGENISEDTYNKIVNEVLVKRAKLRAMGLMKAKDYTEKQMIRKLKEGYYPQTVIEKALDYVKSYRYIDDYRYCNTYIRQNIERMSIKMMQIKLSERGIDKELFQQAFDEVQSELPTCDDYNCDREEEQIKDYLRKKHFVNGETEQKEKVKILQALCRKGYSYEKITKIMRIELDD